MELNLTEVKLTAKEQKKHDVIKKVVNGELSKQEAQLVLNLSRKQIYRLIKIYNLQGEAGFSHKGKGRENKNKKSLSVINEIENLYLSEYFDYNFEAFYEEIQDKYDISYSVMYKAFLQDDIISPIAHKATNKLYNEKMENTIAKKSRDNVSDNLLESKIELFTTRKLEREKAHIRRSNSLSAFRQEIQMVACFKLWFGNTVSALHLAVDKATKKVLFGWFEYEEQTRAYFVVLHHIIINYGIPYKIKTDNRSSFSTNRKEKTKFNTTQFDAVCNMLGILLDTTSVAVSKANVERENGTFKNRLIAELRHENITDIDKANEYLNKVFIPKMNRKFSYDINEDSSMMRKNDYSNEELNLVISEKFNRIIDNASSISFQNKYYVPVDPETNEIISFKHRTECTVIVAYDCSYWCKIEDNYYILYGFSKKPYILEKKNTVENEEHKENKYVPPTDTPWRKDMNKFFK